MAGVAVMVRDKYAVRLEPEQKEELQHLIRVGKSSARVTARARILLKSDDGWAAPQVAEALDVALGTVYRIKQRFAEEGLERALWDRRQANRYRKLDDRGEAHLVASRSTLFSGPVSSLPTVSQLLGNCFGGVQQVAGLHQPSDQPQTDVPGGGGFLRVEPAPGEEQVQCGGRTDVSGQGLGSSRRRYHAQLYLG